MLNIKIKKKRNISMIGLMGSGKSVIGREISNICEFNFYDTDDEIEKKSGKTINDIFRENGEEYFRKIEEDICLDLLSKENCVISLGGGSIINQKIRKIIRINSYCIYLEVKIDELAKRLKTSRKRPLLQNVNINEKLKELYENRKDFYKKADLIVKNSLKKKEAVNKILNNLNL